MASDIAFQPFQNQTGGNVLSEYMKGQQEAEDRKRAMQRQDKMDTRADQQFAGQQDLQKIELTMKRGQALTQLLGRVRDGDAQGFEAAKAQAVQELGLPPEQVAHLTIADLPRLRNESGQTMRDLEVQYKRAQIASEQAQAAAAYANAQRLRAIPPGNIDQNTGARVAPAGVQGRDSGALDKARQSSDAAANIAATLGSAAPALGKIQTGPGAAATRNSAGWFKALGLASDDMTNFIKNFDAVEQASKTIGIDTLQKVGGSDTERELLTAIQTTVNSDVLPEENQRRFQDQIAAADILAKKAHFMTQWVNKAGSLSYTLPDGTSWPQFWSQFQKAAWADHLKERDAPKGGGANAPRRNYRQEQRDILSGKAPNPVLQSIPDGWVRKQ